MKSVTPAKPPKQRFEPRELGASLRSPFGRSLALTLLAFTLIPILAFGGLSAYTIQQQLTARTTGQMITVADLIQQSLSKWIAAGNEQLSTALNSPATAQNAAFLLQTTTASSRVEQVLAQTLGGLVQDRRFATLYLVRPDGSVALSTNAQAKDQPLGIDLAGLDGAKQQQWGFDTLPLTGQKTALIWQPVLNARQETIGFLVGQLDLASLANLLRDNDVGATGEAYLVDEQQTPLTALRDGAFPTTPTASANGAPMPLPLSLANTRSLANTKYSGSFKDFSGAPVIGTIQPLNVPLRAWLVVHQRQSEAFDILYSVGRTAALFIALVIGLAIIASFFTTQRIIVPLRRLTHASSRMARGQLNTRVALDRRDEFGMLSTSFNAMAAKLEETFANVEGSNRKLSNRAEQLDAITRVGQHATTFLEINDLLPTLAREIQSAFQYYSVTLYLFERQNMTLTARAAAGQAADAFMQTPAQFALSDQNLISLSAVQQQLINVPDVARDSRYSPNQVRPAARAVICIPLMVAARLIGVLAIESEKLGAFGSEEVDILQILARQSAIAIRNADLFRESEIARQAADDANRQKSEFLSNMSHELRTPLNVIIGYSHSILNRPAMYEHVVLPSVYEGGIRNIMNSGQHLLGLINDILDLSKIEAGQIDLSIEPTDPLPILNGVRATALGLIKPDVQLRVDFPEKLPEIMGDELRIRQILLNLISNAAKFTEQGFITIDARPEKDWLLFSVADTGMGIPEEAQALLFDRFRQASREVTRKHGGSGLGLNICRQLAVMHGGEIWFESRAGKGSTFYFTIPLVQEAARKEKTKPRQPEGINELSTSGALSALPARAEIFMIDDDSDDALAQQALLIDSQSESRARLQAVLAELKYDVLVTDDADRGKEMADIILPNLIVIHTHPDDSPAMHGLAALCQAHPVLAKLHIVVLNSIQNTAQDVVQDANNLREQLTKLEVTA